MKTFLTKSGSEVSLLEAGERHGVPVRSLPGICDADSGVSSGQATGHVYQWIDEDTIRITLSAGDAMCGAVAIRADDLTQLGCAPVRIVWQMMQREAALVKKIERLTKQLERNKSAKKRNSK